MNMKIYIILLLFYWYMSSCNNSNNKSSSAKEKEPIFDDTTPKNYYVLYGDDSLLMIPDFGLDNLYELNIDSFKDRYSNYQEFKRELLYNPKNIPDLLPWSYHICKNKKIMHDYEHMAFDKFWKKYLYIEGEDTMSFTNDTTLAYCLDKHNYYSDFNYMRTGKIKVIKKNHGVGSDDHFQDKQSTKGNTNETSNELQ